MRLIYHRGASLAELAGALGMSRSTLKWTLNQALGQAADPLHRSMVACWDRLTGREQRLLYLHRILGLSLRKIVREALMDQEGTERLGAPDTVSGLRREARGAVRKIARLGVSTGRWRD